MSMFIPQEQDIILLDNQLFQAPVRSIPLNILGIQVFLAEITPENAKVFLDTKFHNRGIRLPVLRRLIRTLTRGRWEINGETIIFDDAGILLDGQHRLKAVIETGTAIWSLLVYGINQERFKTMGQNAKRSVGDILTIAGERNGRHLATALRWIWRYENKLMLNPHPDIADDELADTLALHPGLQHSLAYGQKTIGFIAPGMVSGLHYLCGLPKPWDAMARASDKRPRDFPKDWRHTKQLQIQERKGIANDFFWKLGTGENLDPETPLLWLREILQKRIQKRQVTRDEYKAPMLINAWNLMRIKADITLKTPARLFWHGKNQQSFPIIL